MIFREVSRLLRQPADTVQLYGLNEFSAKNIQDDVLTFLFLPQFFGLHIPLHNHYIIPLK